jgi:5-formyltetrahydrofolate cyclo-ligase
MPGKEVSTTEIVHAAFKDGKSVFVPYLHPGIAPKTKVMDMLQLRDLHDFGALESDSWGIPSLPEDSVDNRKNALGGIGTQKRQNEEKDGSPELDVIFMPAVAFDRSNQRLGHGKGFYDRYLQTYKTALDSSQTEKGMPYLGRQFLLLPVRTS